MHLGRYFQETHSLFRARLPGYLQAMVFLVEYEKETIEEEYVNKNKNAEKTTTQNGNRPQIPVVVSHASPANQPEQLLRMYQSTPRAEY